MKKSLVKIEKNELFDDDSEDENPYASEEDEDEIEIERLLNLKDEKKIVPPVVVPPVIEKSTSNQSTGPDTKNLKRKPDDPVGLFHKKQKKVEGASMNKYPGASRYSRETSPQPSSSPRSPIPSTSSISSRIKLKIGSTSAFSHDGAPLPPTAAEVLAKETEKRKRKSIASADNLVDQQIKRPGSPSTSHGSASPRSDGGQSPIKQNLQYLGAPQEIKSEVIQPNSAQQSPYSTGANSPDPDKLDTQLQVEVIEILGKNPNISVPTLVTFIKPHFKNAEYKSIFKGVLKNVLKRTCTFEKGSGLLNLKK